MPKHAPHPGFATMKPVFSYFCPERGNPGFATMEAVFSYLCPEMWMGAGMTGKVGFFSCGVVFYGYSYDTTSYVPILGAFPLLSAVGARQCYGDRAESASLRPKWNRQRNSLQHGG
jgi:hypothetical protein